MMRNTRTSIKDKHLSTWVFSLMLCLIWEGLPRKYDSGERTILERTIKRKASFLPFDKWWIWRQLLQNVKFSMIDLSVRTGCFAWTVRRVWCREACPVPSETDAWPHLRRWLEENWILEAQHDKVAYSSLVLYVAKQGVSRIIKHLNTCNTIKWKCCIPSQSYMPSLFGEGLNWVWGRKAFLGLCKTRTILLYVLKTVVPLATGLSADFTALDRNNY